MRATARRHGLAVLAVLGLILGLAACSPATVAPPAPTVTATPGSTPASTATADPGSAGNELAPAEATSDLPTMTVAQLPPEATAMLALIAEGGPYEYSQDGQTFQNREGILPAAAYGSYSEYTVETPGSSDRGARRLVVSDTGAVFYTDDHYQSFREVIA